jgi:uncharacterized protein (TIGR03905 family)
MKELVYETQGTCAKAIRILLNDDNVIEEVRFLGGCSGNTSGISSLIKGMKAEDVINRLEGIRCGNKNTSCPDQLSKALKEMTSREVN